MNKNNSSCRTLGLEAIIHVLQYTLANAKKVRYKLEIKPFIHLYSYYHKCIGTANLGNSALYCNFIFSIMCDHSMKTGYSVSQ